MKIHLRGTSGRPLCGAEPRGRRLEFAERDKPGKSTCSKCWARYRPPKVQELSDAELLELDRGWRAGWAQEFPDDPYPGMVPAMRRIRAKLATWAGTPSGSELRPR